MNKGISKWPSKVLNLLVVLSMVIALCAILAPVASAQEGPELAVDITSPGNNTTMCIGQVFTVVGNITNPGDETAFNVVVSLTMPSNVCAERLTARDITYEFVLAGQEKHPEWEVRCTGGGDIEITVTATGNGISAVTDVITVVQSPEYAVDVDTYSVVGGVLTPDSTFRVAECFYVNATIINATCVAIGNATVPVTGNITLGSGVELHISESGAYGKIASFNDNIDGKLGSKRVADVWWRVCCTAAGTSDITVTGYHGADLLATKTIHVTQTIEDSPDLRVTILEPTDYPFTICESQQFVVKALIENLRGSQIGSSRGDVTATITFPGSVELAYAPGGTGQPDPGTWELNYLPPYGNHTVAWQLHCTGRGQGTITVTANASGYIPAADSFLVTQLSGDASFEVSFTTSKENLCAGGSLCGETFQLTANIQNTGCHSATGVKATLSITDGAGNVTVTETLVRQVADIGPGGSASPVVWNVRCINPGSATFEVTVDGTDAEEGTPIPAVTQGPITVDQLALTVDIIDPSGSSKNVAVGRDFTIKARVKNCWNQERSNVNVSLGLFDGAILKPGSQVSIVHYSRTGVGQDPVYVNAATDLILELLCPCCYAEITWTLTCVDNIDGDLTVTASDDDRGVIDEGSDEVHIIQQCKAHLMAGTETFPGIVLSGTGHSGVVNSSFRTVASHRMAVGSYYTLVVPVTNVGEESANSVYVTVAVTGPATLTGSGTQSLGTIYGGNSAKAVWTVLCTGVGTVEFTVTSITGIHANSGVAIDQTNINIVCPTSVEQVISSMTVDIINPLPNEHFNVCQDFAVKAIIHNTGGDTIEGVTATISWGPDDADLIPEPGPISQPYTKGAGDIPASGWAEVSWVLHCTSPGEMNIVVTAQSTAPAHTAVDNVWVVQIGKPEIQVTILSPDPEPSYEDDGWGTAIATGETFAVTARVNSTGSETAHDVLAGAYAYYGTAIVISDSPIDLGDMDPRDTQLVTFTLQCISAGEYRCNTFNETIYVWAESDPDELSVSDDINVTQYAAAHLVVGEITVLPSTTIAVCDEFTVRTNITNIGEADAWEVSAMLSVFPEGSVRLAEGEAGYTKFIGTVAGWGTEDTQWVEWTLHCKQACESTLTINLAGKDECGWHTVFVQDENHRQAEYEWYNYPGQPINPDFIEPASITVKQLENGLDLAITKTADKTMSPAEAQVKFTIKVTNNGPIAASGIVVSDTWTTGALVTPAVISKSQGTGVPPFSNGFTWNVGSLPVGGTATLVYSAVSNSASKITNTATVSAAEADGFLDNNTATVELNVSSYAIPLNEGWNLISLPLVPSDPTTEEVLQSVDFDDIDIVWGYNAETEDWSYRIPDVAGTLTEMNDGYGYWIDMYATATLTVSGTMLPVPVEGETPPAPPAYDVFVGWNLLGFKSTTAKAENVYLLGIAGKYAKIYGYADGAYFDATGANLQPGSGYWIAVPGAVPGTKVGSIFP